MADSEALRAKRSRAHRNGDHSLCRPGRCPELGGGVGRRLAAVPDDAVPGLPADVVELLEALDVELDAEDRTVRALAVRLAKLSATSGPAAVQALRALGELVATQRAGGRPVSGPSTSTATLKGRRKGW